MSNQVEIINRGGDKRIILSQSQLARTMAIGSNWNKLRIGIVISVAGPLADITGTPRLLMGLNAGTNNLPFDATPGHFFGVRSGITFWDWNTFVAGSNHYIVGDNEFFIYKNVGGVETESAILGLETGDFGISEATTTFDNDVSPGISTFFIDFEKIGTTTMNVVLAGQRRDQVMGMTNANFREVMALASTTSGIYYFPTGHLGTIAKGLPIDEATDGYLDTICIAWDRVFNLEISKLAFARLA